MFRFIKSTPFYHALLTVIFAFFFMITDTKAQLPKEIIGYYPAWQWYDRGGLVNPQTIPYSKYSIINYSFFKPNFDGTISGLDAWADENLLQGKINYQTEPNTHYPNTSLVDLAHQAGVKVLISIGGWTESSLFSKIAADPRKRKRFASECRRLVEKYHLDGIDIDWEYPGVADRDGKPVDKQNFTFLLRGIRDSLNMLSTRTPKKYLLTGAFSASKKHMAHIEWGKVSLLLDAINLMTYDFYGSWDSQAGHNSPLFATANDDSGANIDGAVKALTTIYGVSPSKINIGAAFYGRSLKTKETPEVLTALTGKVDTITFHTDEGSPLYYNILKNKHLFTEHWDEYAQVPYLTGKDDLKTFVSYDDARSIANKAHYVTAKKLRGVIIWEMTGDCVETVENEVKTFKTPLLDALIEAFKNPVPFKEPNRKAIAAHQKPVFQQHDDNAKIERLNAERASPQNTIRPDSVNGVMPVSPTIDTSKVINISQNAIDSVKTTAKVSSANPIVQSIEVKIIVPQNAETETLKADMTTQEEAVKIETRKLDIIKNGIDSMKTSTVSNENEGKLAELPLDFTIKPNDENELILVFELKDKREIRVEIANEKGQILRGVILGEMEDGTFQNRIETINELPNGTYKIIFKSFTQRNGQYVKLSETVKEWEKK